MLSTILIGLVFVIFLSVILKLSWKLLKFAVFIVGLIVMGLLCRACFGF